jgi:quinol monooxygenase YgiN
MTATYGMQGRLRAQPGRGDELAAILLEAAAALADDGRCLLYVVGRLADDPDTVVVTEAWTERAAHDASLEDPRARAQIATAMPLIAEIGAPVEFVPVGGKGIS